ncbi:hypothetical protein WOLCODRAFT_137874 [Wolfiporia cocos MD-104 SS10]|uniref:Uncharacterized protein n=1 Tax=Wolfiporia cocos (strain MD-104) TaxID=742152 RepID=A0A2H3JLH7_WOLCO|nr:hypothetical protein WOLCODRAFT_137874 [Wolfiporia cocos MD-104 SS10]
MPTVPPTSVPRTTLCDEPLLVPGGHLLGLHTSRTGAPTPDPELDDVDLVSSESGNAVTTAAEDQPPVAASGPGAHAKPRLTLDNIVLHSPSSILGTPFDLSPRFEYPFPEHASAPDPFLSPALSHSSPLPMIVSPLVALGFPVGVAPVGARGYSAMHPRLHACEPPVPPGLAAKKRRTQTADRVRRRASPIRHEITEELKLRAVEDVRMREAMERRQSDETVVSEASTSDIKGSAQSPGVENDAHRGYLAVPGSGLKSTSEVTLVHLSAPTSPAVERLHACSSADHPLTDDSATSPHTPDRNDSEPGMPPSASVPPTTAAAQYASSVGAGMRL